ncbi:5-(carboxyamino)imidazole ribonucleotide synthase [Parasphingorhabdus sp.]|jgi:5-(carboxyamino)imidazole ribonucleotide synthase|uniref:5-(carboxyamino)imidazole ribonucleotide synthase n=1 Tax=Parasphingorhabdus sp. TaxID=2709688 RepID=UPI0030B4E2DA|nr:5-(carboxyamino)imidazole ribonucleotide synthase [Sphingomonadales bacterium]
MKTLPPGSTIGILGGGQLGRMLSVAAAQLGYRCHIYAPNANSVAAEVSAQFTCAQDDDIASLTRFAKSCDVITFEFENVPVEPLHQISSCAPLHPPIAALDIAQNRIAEKVFARDHDGTTAPFAEVSDRPALDRAIADIGAPAILKTIRMGYDGKGQSRIQPGDDLDSHWQAVAQQPCIAEGFVTFSHEFSVILVRGQDGEIRFWNTPHNVHEDGILAASTAPAPVAILDQQDTARALAARMAEAMNYVGVLTCEFFATKDGPIFNEMAPRVHNSGHWTIEGAITSQFENHIRAICGLPLGDAGLAAKKVEMHNLIGAQADNWETLLSDGTNHLHLYGKGISRPGRKMGHVTKLHF